MVFQAIYSTLSIPYKPTTKSDCEVIIPLYLERGIAGCLEALKGMFSFVVRDWWGQYRLDRDGYCSLYITISILISKAVVVKTYPFEI